MLLFENKMGFRLKLFYFVYQVLVSLLLVTFIASRSISLIERYAIMLFVMLWLFFSYNLLINKNWGYVGSFSCLGIIWFFSLYITIMRIVFVAQNGGLDRADGGGSPVAFLLGFVFEQIFFFIRLHCLASYFGKIENRVAFTEICVPAK
jgi:hypothetical protein